MSITAGQTIVASDFVSTSSGASDSGKVAKLGADGKIDRSFIKASFGGTGADGALSITSGATNIDLGGAKYVVKNYTSISITGTGYLTFTNKHAGGTIVILKSQGNVTITTSATSAIVLDSFGANAQTNAISTFFAPQRGGDGGVASSGAQPAGGGGGGGGSCANNGGAGGGGNGGGGNLYYGYGVGAGICLFTSKTIASGAGGGAGGTGYTGGAGAGGIGGGALYIECGGALNITSTVSAKGSAGGNATGYSGGGGGGGGGEIVILANSITTNTATITVTGGAGGNGGSSGGAGGAAGGDGYSYIGLNTEFV